MRYVHSTEKTTLILNASWMPIGFFSAKNAMRVLLTGGAMALDKNYMQHNFDSWCGDLHHDMRFEDPLFIRGASRDYPVPTILLVKTFNKGTKQRKKRNPSRRDLYTMYGGVCQYCLENIKYADATREHVIPKTHGGTNDDFNIVLACRKCNSDKSDQYPFFNKLGVAVKAKNLHDMHYSLMSLGVVMRKEWNQLLFKS
jgi:hypothetical protein